MKMEQKKVTVNEVEYTLQKLPIRNAMEVRQKWVKPDGRVDDVVMCDECFKNIVVSPKVELDDFTGIEVAEELAMACIEFQYMGK